MAQKIANIDSASLRQIVNEAHWPEPIAELYFHKLASRRHSIMKAFNITDATPIAFDTNLTIIEDGVLVVNKGKLVVDYHRGAHPESLYKKKGRKRNYGN